jgi:hypothetical protein
VAWIFLGWNALARRLPVGDFITTENNISC